MGENVCCPYLEILGCAETSEHCHLVCGYKVEGDPVMDNDYVKQSCLGDFKNCKKRPHEG